MSWRFWGTLIAAAAGLAAQDKDRLADRIIGALNLGQGERVIVRFDPGYFQELVPALERRIRDAGGVVVGPLEYVPKGGAPPALEPLLGEAGVYLWLPLRDDVREVTVRERQALARWLDRGGVRREIHFHWAAGSVRPDGLAGEHSPALDALYEQALDIDYGALSAAQNRVIAALRSGTVRVRTPAGTDLSFRVGDRLFNKQDGDASPQRMKTARVRVDREIELPAGVLRVAPLEESVNGRIVIPEGRFGDQVARGVVLHIEKGRVTRIEADENRQAVEAYLRSDVAGHRFREFGLGFNPKLQPQADSSVLPYYGYGTGVVRLSLGDNAELGGKVRGNFVRWFFFPDATVEVNGRPVME